MALGDGMGWSLSPPGTIRNTITSATTSVDHGLILTLIDAPNVLSRGQGFYCISLQCFLQRHGIAVVLVGARTLDYAD